MRKVIINADDFGLTRSINRGIIEAHKSGIVTSASIMANMPAFQDAVSLAMQNVSLGVGVHLNIVRGKPILPASKISALIDKRGYFYNFHTVLRKLFLGRFNLDDIRKEFRAQIGAVIDSGLTPTHLDTEKHIHSFPQIAGILINLAKEFKIFKIRSFRQNSIFAKNFPHAVFDVKNYKILFLGYMQKNHYKYFAMNNIRTPDCFYSITENKTMLTRILLSLGKGVSEIVCHPGYFSRELVCNNAEFSKFNISNHRREMELHLLVSRELKDIIATSNINLINYNKL